MAIYANLNKFSQYASQVTNLPFIVHLDELSRDDYCWQGNSSQYRTIDLDFYFKSAEGDFIPHGLMGNNFKALCRFTEAVNDGIVKQLKSVDLYTK